jgi:disulfide bond formation protein DsbB
MKSPSLYALLGMIALLIIELALNGFEPVQAVSASLPVFVLLAEIALPFLLLAVVLRGKFPLIDVVAEDGQMLAFLVATTAMLGSLFYQFGQGLVPCELCWFQRICMYPLVFIIGVSLWKRQSDVFYYAVPLCLIGAAISVYQYYAQMFSVVLSCSGGTDCSQIQTISFGYITIPLMALTAFLSITLLLYLRKWKK